MRSCANRKTNTWLHVLFMTGLLILLSGLLCCSFSFAAGGTAVKLPYAHTYDAAGNRTNDVFTYRITPVGDAPAPEGSKNGAYDFSIKGVPGGAPEEGMLELEIAFAGTGEYEYEVSAYVPDKKDGFTYDDASYTVRVYVSGSGTPQVIILGEDGRKCMALSFRAGHDAEVLRPEEARPTTTPTGDGTVPEEGIVTAPAGRSRVLRAADDTGAAGPADNAGAPADNTAPQEAPSELMGNLPVPKALQQTGNWALLNLIFAILTVMIASELLRRYFERIDTEEDEYIVRREGRLRLGGILPAAGAILMEAATQDFTKPMVLFDDRVWLMAALLFAEMAVAAAVYVRYDRGGGKGGWLEKDPA